MPDRRPPQLATAAPTMENHSPHEACDRRIAELEARLEQLTAELETTLRRLDAARSEIARAFSCQVSPQ